MSKVLKSRSNWLYYATLLILIGCGLVLRLIDLADPPLGFNPTRQLRSAIIARGMYYQASPQTDAFKRELAIQHWNRMERLEPPVLEAFVAQTYRLIGGEQFWVVRLYSSLFWLLGGVVLFFWISRSLSAPAALAGLGIYFFLPFSVFASRSFQPDPLMVSLVILSGYALYRWSEQGASLRWASLAGISAGLALFVKPMAIFFVGGLMVGVLIWDLRQRRDLADRRDRRFVWGTWAMIALLTILPAGLYYLFGNRAQATESFLSWTVLARWQDVLSPSFFMRWLIRLSSLTGLSLFFIALVGPWLLKGRQRALLLGWWGGYLAFGIFFPYHIVTHDYYHLPLIPLLCLSLAPLAELIMTRMRASGLLARLVLLGVILVAFFYMAWMARSILVGQDYRHAPDFWYYVGEQVPANSSLIGYSQDYGFQLIYYGWRAMELLPAGISGEEFQNRAGGFDYYLSTDPTRESSSLQEYLASHYPVHAEGGGYLIYDLQP